MGMCGKLHVATHTPRHRLLVAVVKCRHMYTSTTDRPTLVQVAGCCVRHAFMWYTRSAVDLELAVVVVVVVKEVVVVVVSVVVVVVVVITGSISRL